MGAAGPNVYGAGTRRLARVVLPPVVLTGALSLLVLSGLLLMVFVEPPTAWWTGAAALSGDWRPTALAAGLAAAFVAVSVAPPLRALFALSPLGLREIGLVVVALAVWTILVRWAWRGRVLERFLGLPGS